MNGMLEYYYYFFTAMYHLQKELLYALAYYQNAENQLNLFESDDVEKAEFYFELSEIYCSILLLGAVGLVGTSYDQSTNTAYHVADRVAI
ncbi:hypothetical protein [Bacillus haynesii]|uniref:hypothetical protein n=1 Tax=Bacillus haynesii TaxID=1925021 RepID=UPI002DB71ACE|nr:hypothetical protein [Bacillus haynesii]MEC1486958.1 hypothetical protein [Bacillus haynesii]